MTRVLISSYRDGKNKKYKLYEEREEADLWTVIHDRSVLFQGTGEELDAYCSGAGVEFARVDEEQIAATVEMIGAGIGVNTTGPAEAVEVGEGDSEEVVESIPEESFDYTEATKETLEKAKAEIIKEATSEEPSKEAIAVETEEAVEMAPELVSEPPDALAKLDAEIAALKAKKAEMSK